MSSSLRQQWQHEAQLLLSQRYREPSPLMWRLLMLVLLMKPKVPEAPEVVTLLNGD
jgi:hypothetical protein